MTTEFEVSIGPKSETSEVAQFRIRHFEDGKIHATWTLEFGHTWRLNNSDTVWYLRSDQDTSCYNVGEDPFKFPNLDRFFIWDHDPYPNLQAALDKSFK